MKVEIWSDVMCPFCYIGKRKFETALKQFSNPEKIEVVWKSFQLNPELVTDPSKNSINYLAEAKGISLAQAQAMTEQVTQLAQQVGLEYKFDQSIAANTFNAHRFAHFAQQYGKQNEAEEALFHAYFTEAKNIDDKTVLLALGKELGLDETALKAALDGEHFTDEVKADIHEAKQLGVTGVPFFVFDRKYAVSGAQDSKVFLETLEKSFDEWQKANPVPKLDIIEGQSCTADGNCQ